MIRDDRGDLIYGTAKGKFEAVIADIEAAHKRQQPILVGTASIETSELLSGLLKQKGITHEVLNAKQHEREAEIVAQAGRAGAVTIATNMAGRGTDIVLGGSLEAQLAALPDDGSVAAEAAREEARSAWRKHHEEVLASGGLYVIGSERHESRRIDNQLRGRSGRQGDPGATRFYLSLDDTLMRIFTPPRMRSLLLKLGLGEDGEALEHGMVTRAIETAQRKVEAHNFDIRKNLLEYDNVANDQRKAIYELRDELMSATNVAPLIDDIRVDVARAVIDAYIVPQSLEEQWNLEGLEEALQRDFDLRAPLREWLKAEPELDEKDLRARVLQALNDGYAAKRQRDPAALDHAEKVITLQILDQHWREHLAAIDYLRQGIHLRGYAQKDPKQEYKREAFTMFNDMLARFKHAVISNLSRVQLLSQDEIAALEEARRRPLAMQAQHAEAQSILAVGEPLAATPVPSRQPLPAAAMPGRSLPQTADAGAINETVETFARSAPKVGRNDPCPCGSGKKFKQCHGRLA
jgi:preprotein translocase subunit SecA